MRICESCEREYRPRARTQRWCDGCSTARLVCLHCDEPFVVPRWEASRRLFCSPVCASAGTARRGAEHHHHNGGLCLTGGRWRIHCRDGDRIYFYRGVVAAHLGRLLEPHEVVHHINGDETDDRLENLVVTDHSEHARIHWQERRA